MAVTATMQQPDDPFNLWSAAPPPAGQIVVSNGMGPESPITTTSPTNTSVSDPSSFGEQQEQQQLVPYDNNRQVATTTATNNNNQTAGISNPSKLPKEILKMKKNRKRATVGAGVVGGAIGLVALGPLGAVVGGVGTAVATKQIGKRRERKRLEKISDQAIAQQMKHAPDVPVHASESTELL
eukprot:CAMPEP_0168763154 /NCGR_PEP_ID=MMETSP0724-20121128/24213_1 /TAXON_ID=265536 /ORGANISM="Amphiprora sp., Strain CCMP467" /LENGTH=181 /DNA_ID=CAMNT_0008812341 /DNA_START=42 /DNA_END=587 /DNA_ORIENTATION=-